MIWLKSTRIGLWRMCRLGKRPVEMPIAYLREMRRLRPQKAPKLIILVLLQLTLIRCRLVEWMTRIRWTQGQDTWNRILYRQEWGSFQWTVRSWILNSRLDITLAFIPQRGQGRVAPQIEGRLHQEEEASSIKEEDLLSLPVLKEDSSCLCRSLMRSSSKIPPCQRWINRARCCIIMTGGRTYSWEILGGLDRDAFQ